MRVTPCLIRATSSIGSRQDAKIAKVDSSASMADGLGALYQDLLTGSCDCVDRIVLNGYFRPGHHAGGFRIWWHNLTGGVETLHNTRLMQLAGRFSRRALPDRQTICRASPLTRISHQVSSRGA